MRRLMSRGWMTCAVAVWFMACGGTSTLRRGVPTGDDDSDGDDDTVVGSGGTGARAGAPGKGGSGDDGLNVDPGCTCTRTGIRSIDCATATVTVPSVFQDPGSCAALDTRTKRTYCDDGSVQYVFIEGEENQYQLELDREGNATYFSASGYVAPGCGLDPADYDLSTITRGTPTDAACLESCALCGEYASLPACEACKRDPNDPDTALETLEELCSRIDCPTNLDDMLTRAKPCTEGDLSELICACNDIDVRLVAGFSEQTFIFDRASGALRAVRLTDDIPFGPCQTTSYFAGSMSDGPHCNGAEYCDFCTEGGEAGAGGAAGAGSGIACVLLE